MKNTEERLFSPFEVVILSLFQLKAEHNLDFEVRATVDLDTKKPMIEVTLSDSGYENNKRHYRFVISEYMLKQTMPGYLDIVLERAIEEFK